LGVAYLLRVYADTSTVGYYSPLHDHLECASLLPIPERRIELSRAPVWLNPYFVRDPCTNLAMATFMPLGLEWVMHRDPRLDLGFYTEPLGRSGRLPRAVSRGWLLVLVSGLAVYPEGFWDRRRSRREVLKAFREAMGSSRGGVYIVALMEIEEVLEVRDWSRAPRELLQSPHSALGEPVRAVLGDVMLVTPPIPLDAIARGRLRERIERLARGRFRLGRLGDSSEVLELVEGQATLRRLKALNPGRS